MSEKQIRIAVVGQPLSGKDVVAKYLEEKYGFLHISSGDLVRKYVKENNLGEPTREVLHAAANEMRHSGEPGILTKMAVKEAAGRTRMVLSGTRAPSDIDPFVELGGIVVAVEAPIEDRYKRAFDRGRPGDHIPFDQFKFEEERENSSDDPFAQNVYYVVSKAKYTLHNDSTLDTLLVKTDALMNELGISPTVA